MIRLLSDAAVSIGVARVAVGLAVAGADVGEDRVAVDGLRPADARDVVGAAEVVWEVAVPVGLTGVAQLGAAADERVQVPAEVDDGVGANVTRVGVVQVVTDVDSGFGGVAQLLGVTTRVCVESRGPPGVSLDQGPVRE
jgi:hypothetical protein